MRERNEALSNKFGEIPFLVHTQHTARYKFIFFSYYLCCCRMRPVALQQYMSEHDLKSVKLIFISTQRLFTLEKNSIFLYCGAKKIRWKIFKVQEREFSDLFFILSFASFSFLQRDPVEFLFNLREKKYIFFFLLLAFQSIPLSLIYRFCVTRVSCVLFLKFLLVV